MGIETTKNDMPKDTPRSLKEWAQSLLESEYIGTAFQVFKGISLTAAAAYGLPAIAAVGTGLLVASLSKTHYDRKNRKKNLLELYRDEVAAIVHKPAANVDIGDLEQAARFSPNNRPNDMARELEWIEKNASINSQVGALATVALTALTAAASLIIPVAAFQSVIAYAVNSAVSNVTYYGSEKIITAQNGERPVYDANSTIARLNKTLKFEPIAPEHTFAVFVDSDPALKETIRKQQGKPYAQLTFLEKRSVAQQFEPVHHAAALTDLINSGLMKPTELGFIAAGQRSGYLTPKAQRAASFVMPDENAGTGTYHAERALASLTPAISRVLH